MPKGVEFDPQKEIEGDENEGYEMCPKCSMYFAKEDEESDIYYCEYCNHEFELWVGGK